MSNASEHNTIRLPETDEDAARAHEVSSHGTSYWLHQVRVWKAPQLREAFLAGTRYARAADPSTWARGYAEFELAFCDILGLEGNVPPALARETLRALVAERDALKEAAEAKDLEKSPVDEAPKEEGCPFCRAPRAEARRALVRPYACGSYETRSAYEDPARRAMFTQSAQCVFDGATWLRSQPEASTTRYPIANGLTRYTELGIRIQTVLEQSAVRAPEDCEDVKRFVVKESETCTKMLDTISEWMKGASSK